MGAKSIEIDSNSENQGKVAQWATNCQRVKKAPRRGANWKANLKSTRRVENPKNQKDFIPILNGDRRDVLVIKKVSYCLQITSSNTWPFSPKFPPKVSRAFSPTVSPTVLPAFSPAFLPKFPAASYFLILQRTGVNKVLSMESTFSLLRACSPLEEKRESVIVLILWAFRKV